MIGAIRSTFEIKSLPRISRTAFNRDIGIKFFCHFFKMFKKLVFNLTFIRFTNKSKTVKIEILKISQNLECATTYSKTIFFSQQDSNRTNYVRTISTQIKFHLLKEKLNFFDKFRIVSFIPIS